LRIATGNSTKVVAKRQVFAKPGIASEEGLCFRNARVVGSSPTTGFLIFTSQSQSQIAFKPQFFCPEPPPWHVVYLK
jgi:hypothetical protein